MSVVTDGARVLTTATKYEQFEDDALVKSAVEGDAFAKSALVNRFLPRVWRVAYLNCGGAADVEDLVQTAMMNALENLHSYRGPDRFRYWLDRLTVNVIRSHFRKSRIRRIFASAADPDETETLHHYNELRQVEAQQLFRRLRCHLSKISEKNRLALVLSTVHGYQAKEIADLTGCSVEAAWKRTRRGYEELMARISKDPELDQSLRELVYG